MACAQSSPCVWNLAGFSGEESRGTNTTSTRHSCVWVPQRCQAHRLVRLVCKSDNAGELGCRPDVLHLADLVSAELLKCMQSITMLTQGAGSIAA